jgi:hypothetical protein
VLRQLARLDTRRIETTNRSQIDLHNVAAAHLPGAVVLFDPLNAEKREHHPGEDQGVKRTAD